MYATQGLYAAKPWFTRRLAPVEGVLAARGVSPDTVTAAGVVASGLAAGCLALGAGGTPLLWAAVGPLGMVRLAANALDGALARRRGAATPRGNLVNEAGDRLADVLLFAGLAAAVGPLGLAALAAALLASLTGVLALALTGRRDCGGPLGKSERVVVAGAGAATAALSGSSMPLVAAAAVLLCGSLVTAAARLRRIDRALVAGGVR